MWRPISGGACGLCNGCGSPPPRGAIRGDALSPNTTQSSNMAHLGDQTWADVGRPLLAPTFHEFLFLLTRRTCRDRSRSRRSFPRHRRRRVLETTPHFQTQGPRFVCARPPAAPLILRCPSLLVLAVVLCSWFSRPNATYPRPNTPDRKAPGCPAVRVQSVCGTGNARRAA